MQIKIYILLLLSLTLCFTKYDENSKVQKITDDGFQEQVIQSKGIWIIEFYDSDNKEYSELQGEWEKLAEALDGIIHVGAADMKFEKPLGELFSINNFPTIKLFGEEKETAIDYEGGRTAKEIINFAFDQAQVVTNQRLGKKTKKAPKFDESDIVVLDQTTFDDIVMKSQDAWFVEFYVPWCKHCKTLAPSWAALGTELKPDGIKVGKIDATKNANISTQFEVNGYPSLRFFPQGRKVAEIVQKYDGSRETSSMASYARDQIASFTQIKFTQLTSRDIYNEYCKEFHGACVVAFLPHIYDTTAEERNKYLKILDDIALKNKAKPLTFLWSEGGSQFDMEDNFWISSGYPIVLTINQKKSMFSVMRSSFTQENLQNYLNDLLQGKVASTAFRGSYTIKKITPWDGLDHKLEAE